MRSIIRNILNNEIGLEPWRFGLFFMPFLFFICWYVLTDKFRSAATDVATTLASGASSLFGSGKMKS